MIPNVKEDDIVVQFTDAKVLVIIFVASLPCVHLLFVVYVEDYNVFSIHDR